MWVGMISYHKKTLCNFMIQLYDMSKHIKKGTVSDSSSDLS